MDETIDIHNFDKRLAHIQSKISNDSNISRTNKKYISEFFDYCIVTGMKKSSITKDWHSLWFIAHYINRDLKKATKEDFNRVVKQIEEQKWSEWTKRIHKVALKKFMKWLNGENKFYPPEVSDISTSQKRLSSFLPEDILSNEEVEKMIKSADSIRDRTLIMFLAFTGGRIGEVLNVRLKHIRFESTGEVIVMLRGKTGYRMVVSIPLSPQLANFIENGHPDKDNSESFLWLTKHNMFGGRKVVGKRYSSRLGKEVEVAQAFYVPLTYAGAVKILKKLALKADIKKKVAPHWFRRYAATQDATYMSDRLMMLKYGWSTPEIVGVYSKLSGKSLIDEERKRHGRLIDGTKPKFTTITCPRCKQDNAPTSKFCNKCGMVLSQDTALKMQELEKVKDELMTNPKHQKLFQEFLEYMRKKSKM